MFILGKFKFMYKVGDRVKAKIDMLDCLIDIGGPPNAIYATRGDELIIRKVHENGFSVSHDGVLDKTFGVNSDEIEIMPN